MQVSIPFEVGTVVLWQYTAHDGVRLKFLSLMEDILLNIDVPHNEEVLILNSQLDGKWGTEERSSEFPLHFGSQSHVIVVAEEKEFVIYSEDDFCYTYQYRRPLNDVISVSSSEGILQIGKVNM